MPLLHPFSKLKKITFIDISLVLLSMVISFYAIFQLEALMERGGIFSTPADIAFGIIAIILALENCRRTFPGVDSLRIQYSKGKEHKPENLVDLGDNCKSAITAAGKWAINRLLGIGDDVYGKRIEEEGAGNLETVLETKGDASTFNKLLVQHKILPSEVFTILSVKSFSEITNFTEAWGKVKEAKGIR